jgi:hypothetical protein
VGGHDDQVGTAGYLGHSNTRSGITEANVEREM